MSGEQRCLVRQIKSPSGKKKSGEDGLSCDSSSLAHEIRVTIVFFHTD